jgi:hypothetical protein
MLGRYIRDSEPKQVLDNVFKTHDRKRYSNTDTPENPGTKTLNECKRSANMADETIFAQLSES